MMQSKQIKFDNKVVFEANYDKDGNLDTFQIYTGKKVLGFTKKDTVDLAYWLRTEVLGQGVGNPFEVETPVQGNVEPKKAVSEDLEKRAVRSRTTDMSHQLGKVHKVKIKR